MITLGIDIGTSSVKSALVDGHDHVLASVSRPLSVSRPQPGFGEQDPEHWWQAMCDGLDELQAHHGKDLAQVQAIGLSGQMHGATLLDAKGDVLRPCILWNDSRSAPQCARLTNEWPQLHAVTGNLAMPGFTAPKLMWVAEHEPELFARVAKVLLPKAYVRWRLCGEYVEDMSDASGTLWLDVGKRDWSDAALTASGMRRDQMPRLVEGNAISGQLSAALTQRWGFAKPPLIAGGAGDNAAGAVGLGALHAGDAFVSLGTSGVLWATTASFMPAPQSAVHAFCHALPNTWHQMGVILSATDSLNWLSNVSGKKQAELSAAAEASFKGPGEEIFLPYLSGERTPHNNAGARGSFVGLSHLSDQARLAQAVMEGVTFAFRDCQRVLKDAGTSFGRLLAVGGGSRSQLWLKLIATNLDTEIAVPEDGDFGGALGAARLGLCAAEGADPATVMTMPGIKQVIQPDASLRNAYTQQYARYRALYPAIEEARK